MFISYRGYNKSIFEENCDDIVESIFTLSKKESCKLIYPVDVSVSKEINGYGSIKNISEFFMLKNPCIFMNHHHS